MKVKYVEKTRLLRLAQNKIYEVLLIEKKWHRVIDDTGEDDLFPPELFEIIL